MPNLPPEIWEKILINVQECNDFAAMARTNKFFNMIAIPLPEPGDLAG
jgi:hypothetical protein